MPNTIIPPHTPNLDIEKDRKGPLGNDSAPPEPLFETTMMCCPTLTSPRTGLTKVTNPAPELRAHRRVRGYRYPTNTDRGR